MSKKILLFLVVFIVISVSGHEFWIQPDRFIYKRTEPVNIKFLTGENFSGDNWSEDKGTINCLELYYADVVDKDLVTNLGNDKGDSLQLAMIDEGTVMITLNTKDSILGVEAGKFNQHMKDNNPADTVTDENTNGDSTKVIHEKYQRSVKTIFQVGERFTNVFNKKTDLPLDIIPLDHPYTVAEDGNFEVQVFFMGQKLKKTKIKVWHKFDEEITQKDYSTDGDGRMKFFLSPKGEWMVSCAKTIKLENDSSAEWQTYQGSLTWGYY